VGGPSEVARSQPSPGPRRPRRSVGLQPCHAQ
jgi:hypothetical protein